MIKSEFFDFHSLLLGRMMARIRTFGRNIMKYLSLLTWVAQFGFSCLFPTCVFLMLGVYLQNRFSLGVWVTVVLGIIGILTSFSTARSCLQAMRKEIDRISRDEHR